MSNKHYGPDDAVVDTVDTVNQGVVNGIDAIGDFIFGIGTPKPEPSSRRCSCRCKCTCSD